VNFAAGTPGFPPTVLAPTNLVVHAHAWRSYWAEVRDTTSSSNQWLFFRRIPLTNDFQTIGPLAAANTHFCGILENPHGLIMMVPYFFTSGNSAKSSSL
jgi:hypothetical protein